MFCLLVYWQACVKAHNKFTKLLVTKYFCRVCFLGPCTAWIRSPGLMHRCDLKRLLLRDDRVRPCHATLTLTLFLASVSHQGSLATSKSLVERNLPQSSIFRKFLLLALLFLYSFLKKNCIYLYMLNFCISIWYASALLVLLGRLRRHPRRPLGRVPLGAELDRGERTGGGALRVPSGK